LSNACTGSRSARQIVSRWHGDVDRSDEAHHRHAYAQGARSGAIPWLILRDLDRDAPCPGNLVQKLVLDRPSLFLCWVQIFCDGVLDQN